MADEDEDIDPSSNEISSYQMLEKVWNFCSHIYCIFFILNASKWVDECWMFFPSTSLPLLKINEEHFCWWENDRCWGGGRVNINETDFDGDGRISYEEFVKMSMCVVLS